MGIFGPKGARLVFTCVSAVGATKFAPQAEWDLQYSVDTPSVEELRSSRLAPASSDLADDMKKRTKKNPNDSQVPIFYATNREPLSAAECQKHPRKFFGQTGKETPGLYFGLGRVRVKEDAFKLANLQDERDARRLEEILPCKDESEWKRKLREALNGDVKKSIIVFVHGCFTDFPRGLEYGGLVKHGCNFAGPMVVFSWPSIGHKVQNRPYAKDEKSVKGTVPQLKEFLHMLLTEFEAKVHVLSYSMGARAVIGALDLLEEEVMAIDEKLTKGGGELKAAVTNKLKDIVSRGEEAAAGVKVGVRELGTMLARERDILKEKAACLRDGALSLTNPPPLTTDGSTRTGAFGQDQMTGYGGGSGPGQEMVDALPRIERGAESGGVGIEARVGLGEGQEAVSANADIIDERVRRWEALRAKLGHLIFMAPDEEVESFRHTARQWTQGLRTRGSGQTGTGGASEKVKERVKSGLEEEGSGAVEEAAKRGERRPGDVRAALAGLSLVIPEPPMTTRNEADAQSEETALPESEKALDNTLSPLDVANAVTPKFSAWADTLSSTESPPPYFRRDSLWSAALSSPTPSLTTILSGKVLDLDLAPMGGFVTSEELPHEKPPQSQAALISKGPPLPRAISSPPLGSSGRNGDVTLADGDVISPGLRQRAFSGTSRSFNSQGDFRLPSPTSSASSRTPSRSSSSTDLVGEELQQALLWEHLHASGSDRSSDRSSAPSSRASSQPPSRTPSFASLASNKGSFSESTISNEELAATAGKQGMPGGTSTVVGASTVGAGVGATAGAEAVPAGRAEGHPPWRRKSLPALGLHLSTSAPILDPATLEWRLLQAAPKTVQDTTAPLSEPRSGDVSAPGAGAMESDGDSSVPRDDVSFDGPRFSLYTSQSDWALKLAGLATTKPWARGLARMVAFGEPGRNDLGRRVGATLLVEEGYETIDATEVSIGSRNMGHHYLFHRCILEDITHLLSGANTHKRRFEATTSDGRIYWKLERGDFKPATQPMPALYKTWSSVTAEGSKVAPAEQQLLFFASDEVAINFNY